MERVDLVQLSKAPPKDALPLPLTEEHRLSVPLPPLLLDKRLFPPACSCRSAETQHLEPIWTDPS